MVIEYDQKQCDHKARLYVQYLSIDKGEKLSIFVQNIAIYEVHPQKYSPRLLNFCQSGEILSDLVALIHEFDYNPSRVTHGVS